MGQASTQYPHSVSPVPSQYFWGVRRLGIGLLNVKNIQHPVPHAACHFELSNRHRRRRTDWMQIVQLPGVLLGSFVFIVTVRRKKFELYAGLGNETGTRKDTKCRSRGPFLQYVAGRWSHFSFSHNMHISVPLSIRPALPPHCDANLCQMQQHLCNERRVARLQKNVKCLSGIAWPILKRSKLKPSGEVCQKVLEILKLRNI